MAVIAHNLERHLIWAGGEEVLPKANDILVEICGVGGGASQARWGE